MHILARALALTFIVSGLGVICAPKALAADEPIIVVVRLFPRRDARTKRGRGWPSW